MGIGPARRGPSSSSVCLSCLRGPTYRLMISRSFSASLSPGVPASKPRTNMP